MQYQKEIKTVINLISIAIRTAPKACAIDDIISLSASRAQINKIAQAMARIGKDKAKDAANKEIREAILTSWTSDAQTVKESQGLILIGVRGKKPKGVNCSGCGFKTCADFIAYNNKHKKDSVLGPFCLLQIWDHGIAIDSAARTAAQLCVDNRIMYRIGVAVLNLKLLSNQINPILGLPLSVSGKNVFFDRLDKLQAGALLKNYFKK